MLHASHARLLTLATVHFSSVTFVPSTLPDGAIPTYTM